MKPRTDYQNGGALDTPAKRAAYDVVRAFGPVTTASVYGHLTSSKSRLATNHQPEELKRLFSELRAMERAGLMERERSVKGLSRWLVRPHNRKPLKGATA